MTSAQGESAMLDIQDTSSPPNDTPAFQPVFETFSWTNVQSNISFLPPPSTRTPPASDPNSAFLDLQKIPSELDGRTIAMALPNTAIGIKFRADTKFIQIFFDEEEEADEFILKKMLTLNDYEIPIIPPKGKLPEKAIIKLANVPIKSVAKISQALKETLAPYCCPTELAPITIRGTNLATTRWEVVAAAIPGKNLSACLPTSIEIFNQKVLLAWPGSPPSCIQCLEVGHFRQNCPRRTNRAENPQDNPPVQQRDETYAQKAAHKTPEINTQANKETVTPQLEPITKIQPQNTDKQTIRPLQPTLIPMDDPNSPFQFTQIKGPGYPPSSISSPPHKKQIHQSSTFQFNRLASTNSLNMYTDPDTTNSSLPQ